MNQNSQATLGASSLVKGYFQFNTFLISVVLAIARDNIVLSKVIAEIWKHSDNATTKCDRARNKMSDKSTGHQFRKDIWR